MNEDLKAQFKTEGEPAFPQVADTETDNSTDSPTDETTENQTQSPEGEENTGADETKPDDGSEIPDDSEEDDYKGPLHKHPRWVEREDDWKTRYNEQEKRHTDEFKKLQEETDRKIQEALGKKGEDGDTSETEVPEWFGGDEQQFKSFNNYLGTLTEKAQTEAVNEMKQKGEQDQKAVEDATEYFNTEVKGIEDNKDLNPEGVKVDRNKLLKFVLDNELVDTQGKWNYKAGWKLMRANVNNAKNAKIDEKKKVASATTTEKGSEPAIPTVRTSKDYENPSNRPW